MIFCQFSNWASPPPRDLTGKPTPCLPVMNNPRFFLSNRNCHTISRKNILLWKHLTWKNQWISAFYAVKWCFLAERFFDFFCLLGILIWFKIENRHTHPQSVFVSMAEFGPYRCQNNFGWNFGCWGLEFLLNHQTWLVYLTEYDQCKKLCHPWILSQVDWKLFFRILPRVRLHILFFLEIFIKTIFFLIF